ncbi:glycosyltransferase family 39 protein [Patescibacteria group bacterium]|nr:glycosyltransferase family 39 protein [Patescibacteria group bacterium]
MHKTVRKDIFLLFVILIIAAFVRFYHLSEMANFDFDQEYAVNFAYSVTRVFPIQLIGQPLSVEGLFMGPLYFYYLVPFFAVSGLHPLGGFAGSAVLGLITTTAYFFIGKKLFGIKAGLIAALIRSFLFTELIHDLSMTPAYACELLVLLTWWAFYKYWHGEIKNNSSDKLFPFLGFLFGLYTSIHPILFPFYLVFIILILRINMQEIMLL